MKQLASTKTYLQGWLRGIGREIGGGEKSQRGRGKEPFFLLCGESGKGETEKVGEKEEKKRKKVVILE